ncbi:unnamed protein product [Blepharisma stoltei]|uniref:Uncharacterized protein n=1 Tax=Blepharisma stoltei TaxID=1481888 RepID=A0AAU9JUN1_9CILI|nr:unnamed protein product [Blepharisma stoltei]
MVSIEISHKKCFQVNAVTKINIVDFKWNSSFQKNQLKREPAKKLNPFDVDFKNIPRIGTSQQTPKIGTNGKWYMRGWKIRHPSKVIHIGGFDSFFKQEQFQKHRASISPDSSKRTAQENIRYGFKRSSLTPISARSVSKQNDRSYSPYTPMNMISTYKYKKDDEIKEYLVDQDLSSWEEETPKHKRFSSYS